MKTNSLILLMVALCLVAGCHMPHNRTVCPPEVTFSELLSNPAKYAGCKIRLSGFYFSGYEASVLYETPEGVQRREIENGVWIYWPKNDEVAEILFQHKDRPVTVYGAVTCRPGGVGHLALFKVGIDEIDRVELLPLG